MIKYSRVGIKDQRSFQQKWNEIPTVQYDEKKCKTFYREYILPIAKEVGDPLFNIFRILDTYDEEDLNPLIRHVQRLAMRLIIYRHTNPSKGFAINPLNYLIRSINDGPVFANWLKKVRAAAVIKTLSVRPTKYNETYMAENLRDPYGILEIRDSYDYDSFFNERFLIPFEETGSDFEWAFKPIDTKPAIMTAFKTVARSLLLRHKVSIDSYGDQDFATWISDSVTATDDGPKINRTLLRELEEKKELDDIVKYNGIRSLKFNRQTVFVEPGNLRDTWQCYPETLFCIKRVSFLLRQVLEPIESSGMCSSGAFIKRKKLLRQDKKFMMFDIKKCGLTINRELITILGEILNEIYPGKGFDELLAYKDITVMQGSTPHHPPRGVGLGNCNEGVTLIQCVIGEICRIRHDMQSLFFNDDGVIGIPEDGDIHQAFNFIFSIYNGCGIIINLEKTMISKYNIFCEQYTVVKDLDYRKLSLVLIPFAECFFKVNITAAKHLYNTLIRGLIGKNISFDILPDIIAYWGYEFHVSEITLPYEFGGWRYYGCTSVNEVLRFVFDPTLFEGEKGHNSINAQWIGYLIRIGTVIGFKRSGRNIQYRKFVANPYKGWETVLGDSEFAEELLAKIGSKTNTKIREDLDSLYNERGSKNAKPNVKVGFWNKQHIFRKAMWRNFWSVRGEHMRIGKSEGELRAALEFMKETEEVPNGYCPPDFMILETQPIEPDHTTKLGRVLVPSYKNDIRSSYWGRQCLIRSMYLGRIIKGTEIFSLESEIHRNKNKSIISDSLLIDSRRDVMPPTWIYNFLPRRDFARILFIRIYKSKKVPTKWRDYVSTSDVIDMALNPIRYIFPESYSKFTKLARSCPKQIKAALSEMISMYDIDNHVIFNDLCDIFERVVLPTVLDNPGPEWDFDDERGVCQDLPLEHVAGEEVIGERDIDELLEDFIDDHYQNYYDSDSDEDDLLEYQDDTIEFDEVEEYPDRNTLGRVRTDQEN